MSGGTRLDRLVLLLDTGSTPSVRLTAARQLADLAGVRVAHPSTDSHSLGVNWRGIDGEWSEVISLVARVLPYLESRSFETRNAASSALSLISRAVGIWDPTSFSLPSTSHEESDEKSFIPPSTSSTHLSLTAFDLTKMLTEGSLLLASSGNEYTRVAGMSADDLARAQKDALSKLGLGLGAPGGGTADELGVDVEAELAADDIAAPSAGSTSDQVAAPAPSLPPARVTSSPGTINTAALPPPHFKPSRSLSLSTHQPQASTSTSISTVPPSRPPPMRLPSTSSTAPILPTEPPTPTPTGEDGDPFAGLSARERNKLKRKRKTDAKSGSTSGPSSSMSFATTSSAPSANKVRVVESPAVSSGAESGTGGAGAVAIPAGEVVVIDPGAKARQREKEKELGEREGGEVLVDGEAKEWAGQMEVKAGEWPWRGTVERLAVGLLSPIWETRHGAALGLRELLKLQGGGGGQIAGLTKEANDLAHQQWSDDLATKLLCVFALDRFGDYISDQVVAPVRETAAQALATLLPFMPDTSVISVQKILIQMVDQSGSPPSAGIDSKQENGVPKKSNYVWQVRHSGLLGLKYLVAVKGDLLRGIGGGEGVNGGVKLENEVKEEEEDVKMKVDGDEEDVKPVKAEEDIEVNSFKEFKSNEEDTSLGLLKSLVDAAILGLRDRDDDVRSAAAATLAPVTDALVSRLPVELQAVVEILWDCLGDLKDDLSSSIGGVMDLLANLLAFPSVLKLIQSPSLGSRSLTELVPRLFPFFRHTITSVRLSVLNTTLVFLELPSTDHSWADERLLRLLFQNLVVEERQDIKLATSKAWRTCLALSKTDPSRLIEDAGPHLDKWFTILQTPIGTPIDAGLFWAAKKSLSGQGGFVYNVDKPILNQDLALVSVERVVGGRVAGCIALGELLASWPSEGHDRDFRFLLVEGLSSDSAFRRFLIATIVEEWANFSFSQTGRSLLETSPLAAQFSQNVTNLLQKDPPASYSEMTSVIARIQADCQALYALFGQQGKVPPAKLPIVPAVFGIQQAQLVLTSFDALVPLMGRGLKKTVLPALEEQQRKISAAIGYYEATKTKHDRQAYAALAGAVVALRSIPAKVTPLIRSITASIKTEDILELQNRSARSIAAFIDICSSPASTLKTNPSDKVIKNLCTFLCQDESRTPIFALSKNKTKGILSLEYNPARGLAVKEAKEVAVSEEAAAKKLVYRGAQLALSQLAERFGGDLLERVPKLWNCMSDALVEIFASGDITKADAILASDDNRGQDLLDCLTVLPTGAQKVGETLHDRLAELFPLLALATQSKFSVVRYAVAKCFASLSDTVPTEGLRTVVEAVVPILGDPLNLNNRRGAIEVISHIVELLDIKILPYVIFLVVPVLGRMSDPDDDVRLVATNTFATLVKLVPLEAGLPDPPGFPAELLARRQHERDFLAQLLDGNKVEEYKIPVPISIELRKYQRDGVSWLAFLAKYQLHGLLCDDMGLGKTLQSICILSSKHFERAQRHVETKSVDSVHLPSLVICPPTLTGHWKQEIKTYAPNLHPIVYTGSKAERERLVASIPRADVVIASYDIVRNDIDALGAFDWHYCILDEGHVIKNGKTKLTKAVKTLRAIHRLILSGTPIQNNVLELWSLFDFLMPGFLGSEAAFNERFGKPIAASRDAKSSSKEQEAGTLALEALHKQVLPFLLRRLKEDVLDDLPPKIIQDYYCELSPLQKQLYDDFSTSQAKQVVDGEVASAASGGGQPQHVFQALQYLRKLVNHPALVMKADVPKHQELLSKLEQDGGKLRDVANAPKLQALRQILFDCGIGVASSSEDSGLGDVSQHRVLIFCQLKQMLDIVENDLLRTLMPTVTYMRMDGATDVSKRHAVVQTFNSDPSIDCLLLTTHVGGLGLNLTGADTVIFVEHDWNPMKDLQAMDRAHRLGQKKVVNVYRLIMRGTLEEKIMGLQRFKLNIASSVVTQQNTDLASLGTDSVLDLFTVSSSDAAPVVAKDRPVGQKAILEGLGDLPPEDEYQDLDLQSFTSR